MSIRTEISGEEGWLSRGARTKLGGDTTVGLSLWLPAHPSVGRATKTRQCERPFPKRNLGFQSPEEGTDSWVAKNELRACLQCLGWGVT